jgi:hypothetical protein
MENTPLDDLLNDAPADPVEMPEVETPEAKAERERDENGRFVSKGVDESAPPAPDKLPQDVYEPLKAVRDENKALKDQLAEFKRQMEEQRNPPPPPVSVFEDEQAWQQQFGGQVVSQAVNQATFNAKLDMSEMMVRQANPDFDEAKEAFLALAEQNPSLREQALADPHPWNKAYQIAKNHKAMQELGATDVESLTAKIREQLMNEMQGQIPAVTRSAIPPSLTAEQNMGGRTGPAWAGPKPLDELLR